MFVLSTSSAEILTACVWYIYCATVQQEQCTADDHRHPVNCRVAYNPQRNNPDAVATECDTTSLYNTLQVPRQYDVSHYDRCEYALTLHRKRPFHRSVRLSASNDRATPAIDVLRQAQRRQVLDGRSRQWTDRRLTLTAAAAAARVSRWYPAARQSVAGAFIAACSSFDQRDAGARWSFNANTHLHYVATVANATAVASPFNCAENCVKLS